MKKKCNRFNLLKFIRLQIQSIEQQIIDNFNRNLSMFDIIKLKYLSYAFS